ncbi:MAG: bifunctional diaminohydroxyphosphoribosylaminopyrimidine deaminase/5-amino-6-(5-phosphoribosylamino)uracil reductase RibD [Candidatus Zixiibacteriota bacterium]|nr:MAG: bifunctional diaminohydroxyphosphoribosylaminopyrimidine deaminase/5-amino-6-(5-phosphoribosylamino)uracil reductase RibD [candidate division Zixibacteria bacterium]
MAASSDIDFMRLALNLAEKGRGKTSPNPMVGAVVVSGGKIVGRGYHRAAGTDHAELSAIRKAAGRSRGATMYVNLEPCCHTGRTGPCTEAITDAGISRVVVAAKDPNPLVNGKGVRALRKAGIRVELGILRKEARLLNDAYMGYHENKRPFVTLKLAQTLDGRIATLSGESKYISSAQSLTYTHLLRAEADAVIVGLGTVRADNPTLTVRRVRGNSPYRIVVTASANLPPQAAMLKNNPDQRTIIATTESSAASRIKSRPRRNLIYWSLKKASGGLIDLGDLLDKADDFGLHSLLVEGGGRLATSFLKAGLVDKLVIVTAPVIVGRGIDAVGELNIRRLSQALTFQNCRTFASGPDTVFVGYPRKGA